MQGCHSFGDKSLTGVWGIGCCCLLLHDGTTPLIMACQNGHEIIVNLLLDARSEVNKAMDVS